MAKHQTFAEAIDTPFTNGLLLLVSIAAACFASFTIWNFIIDTIVDRVAERVSVVCVEAADG